MLLKFKLLISTFFWMAPIPHPPMLLSDRGTDSSWSCRSLETSSCTPDDNTPTSQLLRSVAAICHSVRASTKNLSRIESYCQRNAICSGEFSRIQLLSSGTDIKYRSLTKLTQDIQCHDRVIQLSPCHCQLPTHCASDLHRVLSALTPPYPASRAKHQTFSHLRLLGTRWESASARNTEHLAVTSVHVTCNALYWLVVTMPSATFRIRNASSLQVPRRRVKTNQEIQDFKHKCSSQQQRNLHTK
jgi:hypothetical protein